MIKPKEDFEIISKVEKFWRDIKEKTEMAIFNSERDIEINKKLLELAEERIKNPKLN